MDKIIINDIRPTFKKTTFSNFKKSEINKKFIQALYYQKLEESFFWTCELLCSNMLLELWEIYFIFMSKYVHIYNPKLPIYINKKFKEFKNIAEYENELSLRNNINIRNILCSITLILCYSEKHSTLDNLNYKFNFQIENLYENLKATNIEFINFIYKKDDPKEYIIPFNELIYHIQETQNKVDINFWINWIIEYDTLCRKKKKIILCYPRSHLYNNKNEKISNNIIWIIWDIILKISKEKNNEIKEIIKSLFDLFTIRYSLSINRKRIYIIYQCIELLLLEKSIDYNIKILKNKEQLQNLEKNINIIFEQIKKSEVSEKNETNTTFKEKKMDMYKNIYNNL